MSVPSAIRCVLFDLDGVIRHFSPEHPSMVAKAHGLDQRELLRGAFAEDLLLAVVTGRISRAEWVAEVGRTVGSPTAAAELLADVGSVDTSMLALIAELQAQQLLCALLTNGTDSIPTELRTLGIDNALDHVFNTADIGAAKPSHEPFLHVCRVLELQPEQVFFTDDRSANTAAAAELGMTAHTFTSEAALRAALQEALGLAGH